MNQVVDRPGTVAVPLFEDGFGRRVLTLDAESGDPVERLAFSSELVEVDEFAPALGDLISRYAATRHASYLRVRRVDRPAPGSLVLVSDRVAGWRLTDLLRVSARERLVVDLSTALNLLRQLVPAVALFSRHQKDLAIGNVSPERLIVTPQGRLVIAEHLLGSALESLHYSRERYWCDLGVALPPAPRISPRADATGIGLVALSLLLGRPLDEPEYPEQVSALLASATERLDGTSRPLSTGLQSWLARALQIDVRTAFQSPGEAQVAFESVLASDRAYVTTAGALDEWLERCAGIIGPPADLAAPPPVAEPVAAIVVEPPAPLSAPPESPPPAAEPVVPVVRDVPERPVRGWRASTTLADATANLPTPDLLAVASSETPGPSRVLIAMAAFAVLEAVVIGWLWTRPSKPAVAGEGELVVQTRPASARVSIDGDDRGVSPLTARLSPGTHVLEVRVGRSEPRVIPLTILAGVQTAQYIELQSVPTTGGLEVRSEPARARVTVDGAPRGSTPLVLNDLPPGDHEVVLDAGRGRQVKQRVRIEPGITAQLVVPLPR